MLFRHLAYFVLFAIVLSTTLTITACNKGNDDDSDPPSFPELTEDNTGSRARSITYVYDRTAVDFTNPPKRDSSIILFAYDMTGKISRIRLTQTDLAVYDFTFERNGNKLTAIHCKSWLMPYQMVSDADLDLEYNAFGKPSLMKVSYKNPPTTDVDSFIIKSTNNRIDTLIDLTFAIGSNVDKYAFMYNGSGDITQMDYIRISGNFFVYQNIFKYTLSANPAALVLGDEAIFWNFFAHRIAGSATTNFLIPAILFHSTKQPSKLVLQAFDYVGTYNYQTEYYGTGRPKKMTANVITQAGAFYAREAYYYSYAQ